MKNKAPAKALMMTVWRVRMLDAMHRRRAIRKIMRLKMADVQRV